MAPPLTIAAGTSTDLSEIVAIERLRFAKPWTLRDYQLELSRAHSHLSVARLRPGEVAGFVCFWLLGEAVELVRIATHPRARGQGVADALLEQMLRQAVASGATHANLEVARSNAPALRLYRRHGFETASIRSRYYSDGEDALLMSRLL